MRTENMETEEGQFANIFDTDQGSTALEIKEFIALSVSDTSDSGSRHQIRTGGIQPKLSSVHKVGLSQRFTD